MTQRASSVWVVDCPAAARSALEAFPAHRKIRSWMYLLALGLPALSGIVVPDWDERTASAVDTFASELGVEELLVRSDQPFESGTSPRGGLIVPISQIEATCRRFLKEGRTTFLLEPRSPFCDLYSFSVRFQGSRSEVEIVGPGFDASDLKRGDASPHESVTLEKSGESIAVVSRQVDKSGYAQSWVRRLRKVGRMAVGPLAEVSDRKAEAAAREFLLLRRETLLLDHQTEYVPMPERLLLAAVEAAWAGSQELTASGGQIGGVFSASYMAGTEELVFWDIVWPGSKYQTNPAWRGAGEVPEASSAAELFGIAASPGLYTGRACLADGSLGFRNIKPGVVLVAPTTDPELTLALDRLGAIVTDHGGKLSHAAVVAREAGVPAVVGTETATTRLRDGDLITVDGGRGTVRLVEPAR
jgi:phosphohistidine swiveling domain-containing protein